MNHQNPSMALKMAFAAPAVDLARMADQLIRLYPKYFARHPDHYVSIRPFVPFVQYCWDNGIHFDTREIYGPIEIAGAEPYVAAGIMFSTIPNALIVSGFDWVMAPTGEFLDGSGCQKFSVVGHLNYGGESFVPYAADAEKSRVLFARTREIVDIDEDVISLGSYRNHHFGHWIYDYLPRLLAWERPKKLFTYTHLPEAHRDALARFGVTSDDIIEGLDGTMYRFRSVTAMHLGDSERPCPTLAKFLHSGLASVKTPATKGRRFYLERSQTHRGRSIANQDEFQAVLNEYGFETIRRPELSIAQQDSKFSEAEIILTPFGSDLVTMFQVRPQTSVVVLNFHDMETVYPNIEQIPARYCSLLDLKYLPVACEIVPRPGKIPYHGDMRVDCEALRETLRKVSA